MITGKAKSCPVITTARLGSVKRRLHTSLVGGGYVSIRRGAASLQVSNAGLNSFEIFLGLVDGV